MNRTFIALAMAALSIRASAQTYTVECSNGFPDCARYVLPELSEKFRSTYPWQQWKIVVFHSALWQWSDESFEGKVSVAVLSTSIPKYTKSGRPSPEYAEQVPVRQFISTMTLGPPHVPSQAELAGGDFFPTERYPEIQSKLFPILHTEAAKNMMRACNMSPTCDLHTP